MTTDNPGQTGPRGPAPGQPQGQRGVERPQAQRSAERTQAPEWAVPRRAGDPGGSRVVGPAGPGPQVQRPAGQRPEPQRPEPQRPGGSPDQAGARRDALRTGGDRALRREQARQARGEVAARTRARRPRTRRAHLRASRLDPWSVMKVSFMLSIAVAIVGVIAVVVLWSALSAAGVFSTINDTIRTQATFGPQAKQFDVLEYVGLNRVLGVSLLLAVVNVILGTALATLFSFVYNLTAGLLGGIEITLAETE